MNENTYSTSFGTPSSIQLDSMAGRTDIVLTFEVSGKTSFEDENSSSTIWTEWDGIEDNVSTTDEFGSN